MQRFCLGLIESFLYGVYAGLVFVPIYNFLARRWGRDGFTVSALGGKNVILCPLS